MSIKEIEGIELPDVDGSIDLIYGGLGGGKTYAATADILADLRRGIVVFATWPIDFSGVDQLDSSGSLLLGILGFKRVYTRIDRSNFHYIPLAKLMDDKFIEEISTMTDLHLYLDEGYAAKLFDSYRKTNMSVKARLAVYGTRHFNRKIVIVAQRPNAIHVSSRAMVNRFFKCERPLAWLQKRLHFAFFIKTEYQEMIDETVNEEVASSIRFYFGRRAIFKAYDSKYLRSGAERLFPSKLQRFRVSYFTRWALLFRKIFKKRQRFSAVASPIQPNTLDTTPKSLFRNKNTQ